MMSTVPSRERSRSIGLDAGGAIVASSGREVRQLRRAAGLSQMRLALAVGVSRQYISRLELGRVRDVKVVALALIYAALGHRLSLKAFPVGQPLRDAAQLRLLERFCARLAATWRQTREAAMSITGDLRAWDLLLSGPVRIGVEAVTVLSDLQALERAIERKQRDSGVHFVVLLVSNTHRNRSVLEAHRVALRQRFPLGTREVLTALAAGRSPRGNGIVVM